MVPLEINRLMSLVYRWSWGLILKADNKSEGPVRTGLKSSDDEVSKCITFGRESIILKNQCLNALSLRGSALI